MPSASVTIATIATPRMRISERTLYRRSFIALKDASRAPALTRATSGARRRRRDTERLLHVFDIRARVGDDVLVRRACFERVPAAVADVVELLRHARPLDF